MVGAAVMRAPEAAVAEYALTESPEQGNSTIIVPITDKHQVALLRTSATRTDKGRRDRDCAVVEGRAPQRIVQLPRSHIQHHEHGW